VNPLDTFLQTGRLPSIEREKALTAIERFHADVLDGARMRILVIVGEAGVGKSALIDRTTERIEGAGDVVLRLRAWSEGAGALGEQIRETLRRSPQAELLLRGAVEPTLPAAIAALRRIVRLRPTLLAIEDVHLLSGEPLAELVRAFEAIEEEPLGIILTGRTVPATVEGVVLPWLEERLHLDGFNSREIERLWRTLTGMSPPKGVVEALLDATHGNALALRSGLRAALRTIDQRGLIRREEAQTRVATQPLLDELHRQVDLLADGMIAHMNAQERSGAARIALLGEVFDPATALQLPGVSRELLDALVARGTLAPAAAPASPLLHPHRLSTTPLAFTHSLLHEALRRHTPNDPATAEALLRVVESEATLLSLAPLWSIGSIPLDTVPTPLLRSAALALAAIAAALRIGVHHEVAQRVMEVAQRLGRAAHRDDGDPNALHDLDCRLAVLAVGMQLNALHTPEFSRQVEALCTLTANPQDAAAADVRIDALRFRQAILYRSDYPRFDGEASRSIGDEVELLLMRYPELRHTEGYLRYLMMTAQAGSLDNDMLSRIEEEASTLLDDPALPPAPRTAVVREIYPFLLKQFATPQQRNERERMIEQIELLDTPPDLHTRSRILQFHMMAGNYATALQTIAAAEQQFLVGGLWPQYCNVRLDRTRILAAQGAPLERCEQEAEGLIAAAPEVLRARTRRFCGLHLAITALLCGAPATARRWVTAYASIELLTPYEQALILLGAGEVDRLHTAIEKNHAFEMLRGASALATGAPLCDKDLSQLRDSLARPIIEIGQVPVRHALLLLVREALHRRGETLLAQNGISPLPPLEDLLEWTASRTMPAFGRPLLALGEEFGLGVRALRTWRSRFNVPFESVPSSASHRTQIRICGTVEAVPPDGEPIPIRGARLRTVLGLMVAQQMLREPLDAREFRHIAAGSDAALDAENARKTMNAAVVRLRDLLGEDAINTAGPVPTLDAERVAIDLLDADAELRTARTALRMGALQRAVRAVRRTLALTRGEPPFPALYEEFFEALREDFEARLRSITVEVVARLLEENDPAAAEELALLALRYMPEDVEMIEMRAEALERLGSRADAARARMAARHEEMIDDDER